MAKETVEAVRSAELEADKIEQHARDEKEDILNKARADAAALIQTAESEARDLANAILAAAGERSEQAVARAQVESQAETTELTRQAQANREAAKAAVLGQILE